VPGDDDPHPLPVRCGIYTRQSVVRDGDPAIASCKVQRTKCIEFIRSMAWRGWFVAGEHFDDEGQSGATTDRPGLAKLLRRIEDGAVHRVIVYRLDRLTRRLADWAKLAAVFERHDIGLTVARGASTPRPDRFNASSSTCSPRSPRWSVVARLEARKFGPEVGQRFFGFGAAGFCFGSRARSSA